MIISHKYKFIYFHNPKCGGTSVGNVIASEICGDGDILVGNYKTSMHSLVHDSNSIFYRKKHITPVELQRIYSVDVEDYYKFGFTRNPYSIAVSWYFFWFQWKGGGLGQPGYQAWLKIQCMNFSEFIRSEWFTNLTTVTDRLLCSKTGKQLVDFIGRFENLQQDFDIVCDKIGIPQQILPHKNKSKHKHYTEYYNDETRAIVARKYAKDIDYFGYKFEG